jgi:DNA-binding NtrC family response regulator
LLAHFLERHASEAGRPALRLGDEAVALLERYSWPGNVRELSNVVERMSVLATSDVLALEDLPEEVRDQAGPSAPRRYSEVTDRAASALPLPSYHEAVREAKRGILREALRRSENVQTHAAKLLGITQPYMARLMKNLGVTKTDPERR